MEQLIASIVSGTGLVVPVLAVWAILGLWFAQGAVRCHVTELFYYGTLLLVTGFTLRTVLVDDACWLVHTASLGAMIVVGVSKRPSGTARFDDWSTVGRMIQDV